MSGARMSWLPVGGVVVVALSMATTLSLSFAAGRASGQTHSCPHPSVPVPPGEPIYSTGPTGLVSGLYVQGGAVPPPPCKPEPRGPYAGTVKLVNPATGATVARVSVTNGHLAHIRSTPGRYDVIGHFSGGYTSPPVKVTIRSGKKVRQDLFEDVP